MVSVDMMGVISMANAGGTNVFHFVSSDGQMTQNLNGSVIEEVRLPVHTDESGNFFANVSADLDGAFTLGCVRCDAIPISSDIKKIMSFFLGAATGIAFVLAAGMRF